MTESPQEDGLQWQVGVWNRISDIYLREIDARFASVVEGVVSRAELAQGENVLDLGTGTGTVAQRAIEQVAPNGSVTAIDLSTNMLALTRRRFERLGASNVQILEGRGESIPADDNAFDVVLASLSLMYVIDREAAAKEIQRVLRPGGRLVGSVWAGPEECDIVLFQSTAGRFAGPPPVPGVGPGALADTSSFISQLEEAGIDAHVEREILGFEFADFASAWDALAGVTTANLPPEAQQQAKDATIAAMAWRDGGSRQFRNATQFIIGRVKRG